MKLIAFKYGETEITDKAAFLGGNKDKTITVALLFFLIEHNNKKILIDVGCDTMPDFKLLNFKNPVNVLESYGVKRDRITDVIITHSHHDHIDSVYNYPQANIYIHKDELNCASEYLHSNENISVFSENVKIAENIEIRHIGGHSAGSSIVLVECGKTTYIFCGDECYTKENLSKNIPSGSSDFLEKNIAFIAEYRKEKYTAVLSHDPEIMTETGFKILYQE